MFYLQNYSEFRQYVIFCNNYNKTSKVVLLSSKNKMLAVFNLFWKSDKYKKASI